MKTHQLIRNELDEKERLRLFRKLRLIAVRKGIPDHEVDDLAQECFQKVWKCLNNRELSCKCGGAFDNAQCQRCGTEFSQAFENYLVRSLANLITSRFRKKRRQPRLRELNDQAEAIKAPPIEAADKPTINQEQIIKACESVREQLRPEDIQLLRNRYISDWSWIKVGEYLKPPINADQARKKAGRIGNSILRQFQSELGLLVHELLLYPFSQLAGQLLTEETHD